MKLPLVFHCFQHILYLLITPGNATHYFVASFEVIIYFYYFIEYFRRLYEYTRLPLLPMYGGFPVKMITHIGKPIYCIEGMKSSELALMVSTFTLHRVGATGHTIS